MNNNELYYGLYYGLDKLWGKFNNIIYDNLNIELRYRLRRDLTVTEFRIELCTELNDELKDELGYE